MSCTNTNTIWSWSILFILHWGKGELEQLDGVAQVGFDLLLLIIGQYQQNELSEDFIQLRRGNNMLFSIADRGNSNESQLN